jgi:hypothetical protein
MAIGFERIIIVPLENATRDDVVQNPYMNSLRRKGVFLKSSYGVTHSSQPNYIAMIGGDTLGILDDTPGWVQWIYEGSPPPVTSIVDLLEAQDYTWKAYAEDLLPGDVITDPSKNPNPPAGHGCFARKHVPFLSFPNIVTVPSRASNIVNAQSQFEADLASGNLPDYCFYTPNLLHDGHSLNCDGNSRISPLDNRGQNIANIAKFLQGFLSDDPVAKFPPETLIVITFDEAYPYSDGYNIYTLLIGDTLPAGTTRYEPYNHYSLLHSVELNFGVGTLDRNDSCAAPYWFLAIK